MKRSRADSQLFLRYIYVESKLWLPLKTGLLLYKARSIAKRFEAGEQSTVLDEFQLTKSQYSSFRADKPLYRAMVSESERRELSKLFPSYKPLNMALDEFQLTERE
ncbi:unnamed protein product [Soboliphyme baturini]|uniref:Homeobox domain-containing protein n=1 Tax=Soboliphyme baturini TaxID=241478 RepID=A0A183J1X3_9BILA|nr:unnamed protein product [Soboliphyme baturini]